MNLEVRWRPCCHLPPRHDQRPALLGRPDESGEEMLTRLLAAAPVGAPAASLAGERLPVASPRLRARWDREALRLRSTGSAFLACKRRARLQARSRARSVAEKGDGEVFSLDIGFERAGVHEISRGYTPPSPPFLATPLAQRSSCRETSPLGRRASHPGRRRSAGGRDRQPS
jgi:hypothetical protein